MNTFKDILIISILIIGFVICIIPFTSSVKNFLYKSEKKRRQDLKKWKHRQKIEYLQKRHGRLK